MLILKTHSPKRAIKSLIKQRPLRVEIDLFKTNLKTLLQQMAVVEAQPKDESEEHLKNNIRDFLRDTFYKETQAINTKDKKDLVIHIGKTTDTNVAVVIEAKRPSNINEMITPSNANKKALHELILYYFDERQNNTELKNLIITDINQWYVFDANDFDKCIYRNTNLKKLYETKLSDKKDNPFFYEEVAKTLDKINDELPCTFFNLKQYNAILNDASQANDEELVALYTLLSPKHLLKQNYNNDSNALNEPFYKELLHLMGLEEAKEGSKLIIRRKEQNRHSASLIEQTIDAITNEEVLRHVPNKLEFGESPEEQTFNIALELCITWINRILFLKLLEGQLVAYQNGNKNYEFLNTTTIPDFDELFTLFHQVLAVNIDGRAQQLKQKYERVPYLNSSLFDISNLEDQTIKIKSLNNKTELELLSSTVLKDTKKKQSKLTTLSYIFDFLNAYDFGSDGSGGAIREENKSIINASVLGTVFEKINGYKDGSVYTPSFITMYMCKQSIRLAVLQKFNDAKGWNLQSFDELYNKVDDIKEANQIINSLKICDPAVGSGHFLVSALNEVITIKSDLEILVDENGKRLKDTFIEVLDDELFITDDESKQLKYSFLNPYSQRVQKTLFNEKRTIIENCLFGVDINPKSVLICRLRLWIELLKNAYYKEETKFNELETLPNIDINIKTGNSLISRFALDADLTKALKSIKYDIKAYRGFVNDYKNEKSKDVKRGLQQIIDSIKSDFKTEINKNAKEYRKLQELQYEFNLLAAPNIFDNDAVEEPQAHYGTPENNKKQKERIATLQAEINKRTKEFDDIKNNKIYQNAFEWRFEFPEVLNDNGDFEGFDLIIGNPPYGVSMKGKLRDEVVNSFGKLPDFEIYYYFINLSKKLLKLNGIKTFIIPNTILFNVFAKNYRENLFNNWQIQELLDCTNFDVFKGSATVRCIVTLLINKTSNGNIQYRPTANALSFEDLVSRKLNGTTKDVLLNNNQNWALVFKLSQNKLDIIQKIKQNKKQLAHFFTEISQGLIAYDKYQGQDETTIKNRIYHSNKKQKNWKKWLWGEDVTPYAVSWNEKEYINYTKGIANPRNPIYFNSERILVREITNPKIYAGYTNEESYNDPAIINIIKNEKNYFELKSLLAILNSKLATFYHFNSSPKATKGAFPKILVEDIKNFPIPKVTKTQHNKFITLADKIIALKAEGKDTIKLEQQIDELVYALYELSPEEISIIEEN